MSGLNDSASSGVTAPGAGASPVGNMAAKPAIGAVIGSGPTGDVPATIYLLADHLDAVLAGGEDLLKLTAVLDDPSKSDGAGPAWRNLAELVARAGELELNVLARVLQARTRARDLSRFDNEVAPVLALFAASTTVLADAAAELADRTFADFDGGTDPLAYLRSRGVIAADAGGLDGLKRITIGEDFLVARRIALGPLLDVTAGLLDILDANYGLFPEEKARRA